MQDNEELPSKIITAMICLPSGVQILPDHTIAEKWPTQPTQAQLFTHVRDWANLGSKHHVKSNSMQSFRGYLALYGI
jgi:hypothetical protein